MSIPAAASHAVSPGSVRVMPARERTGRASAFFRTAPSGDQCFIWFFMYTNSSNKSALNNPQSLEAQGFATETVLSELQE
ncbi:hypothetical protein V4D00_24185, partial [Ralstonia solanacearum]|uniref:hypothetical protein n=1 Tax=Ralstonia solanacearum TaxID=305 RepID=UPI002F9544E5